MSRSVTPTPTSACRRAVWISRDQLLIEPAPRQEGADIRQKYLARLGEPLLELGYRRAEDPHAYAPSAACAPSPRGSSPPISSAVLSTPLGGAACGHLLEDLIQQPVDERGGLLRREYLGPAPPLVDGHLGGRLGPRHLVVAAEAQDGAIHGGLTGRGPGGRQFQHRGVRPRAILERAPSPAPSPFSFSPFENTASISRIESSMCSRTVTASPPPPASSWKSV